MPLIQGEVNTILMCFIDSQHKRLSCFVQGYEAKFDEKFVRQIKENGDNASDILLFRAINKDNAKLKAAEDEIKAR